MTKTKQKILYVRTDIYDKELVAGGSVSHTLGVIKGFINAGYSIIYASSLKISGIEKLSCEHVTVLKNPSSVKWLRWKLNCFLSNIFFTKQLMALLTSYDVQFIYQRYSLLNCSGALASIIKKVPLILEYNGSEVWINKNWAYKKWFKLQWLSNKIELFNLYKASSIVVVSQALKDELISRGIVPDKILVNPNGVDVDFYDGALLTNERKEIRKQHGIQDKMVFGFIGTFSQWHGVNILATMIPEIIKQRNNIHFLLIGDGPLLPELKENISRYKVEHQVTYVGCVPQSEGRSYLAACDIFLCPTQPNNDGSRFFGSPTKMFEYLSMNCPIIASDLEQLSEILQPAIKLEKEQSFLHLSDECGVLVQPHDHQGFIKAALFLIDQPHHRLIKMGASARKRAVHHYSWNNHVKKIIEFNINNYRH